MRPTLLLLVAASALAQNSAFDVASVKINQQYQADNGSTWQPKIEIAPGTLTMRNVNVFSLIKWAYRVQKYQIVAPQGFEFINRGETLVDTVHYDVLGKCSLPCTEDEMRPMLQSLLADRFKLTFHRETRTLPVYALVEAKGGHKMRPSQLTKSEEGREDPQRGNLARGVAMEEIAAELSDTRDFHMAVIDATGLRGRFDFEINFRKHVPQFKPGDPPLDVLSIVQETLQQDIGLRLEPRKVPIEVLVIDHVEKTPAEN